MKNEDSLKTRAVFAKAIFRIKGFRQSRGNTQKLSAAAEGLLRVVIYPNQFNEDPLDRVERVAGFALADPRPGGKPPQDYLAAIETGLESPRALCELIPQPHSEEVIRPYLSPLGEDLRHRLSGGGAPGGAAPRGREPARRTAGSSTRATATTWCS
jgi:hypothetical protein